jgi:RNase P subunit RPR2
MTKGQRPSTPNKRTALLCPGCSRPLAHRRSSSTFRGKKSARYHTYECAACGDFEVSEKAGTAAPTRSD